LQAFRDRVSQELYDYGGIDATGTQRILTAIETAFPDWRTSAGIPKRESLIKRNIQWLQEDWRVQGVSAGDPTQFRE
jgi:hypothetical protein